MAGTGEALPVATATKEESDRPRDDQPTGSQATGSGELLPGPSVGEGAESDDEYTSESEEEIPTLQALRCQRAPGYGTRARCPRRLSLSGT